MYLPALKSNLRWYWGKDAKPGSFKSQHGWVPGKLWGLSVTGNRNVFIGVMGWRLATAAERFTEGGN